MPPSQPVILNYTLEDLYSQDGGDSNIALFFAMPTSHNQGLASNPSSQKYIYQMSVAAALNDDEETVAKRRLHHTVLKFSFTAGKLPLLLKGFHYNDLIDDALEVFKTIAPRPEAAVGDFPDVRGYQTCAGFENSNYMPHGSCCAFPTSRRSGCPL